MSAKPGMPVPATGECWLNLRAITADGKIQHVGCRRVQKVEVHGIKKVILIAEFPTTYIGEAEYFIGPSDSREQAPTILTPLGKFRTSSGDTITARLSLNITNVNDG